MSVPPIVADPAPVTFPIWRCRARAADGSVAWVAVAQSDRHDDAAVIDLPEAEALVHLGDDAMVFARPDADQRVTRLEVTASAAPKAPPLWFGELHDATASPATATLIAFTGHDVEPGTLLDAAELKGTSVTSADQIGAFSWVPSSGFGDQLYVAPTWRRRSIGTALLAAAGTLTFARGWPRLWGDGQRTAEGDRMRAASRWTHMSADLTHLMPPMTPLKERP